MKNRKKLDFESLENRRMLAGDLVCDVTQFMDTEAQPETCIVATETGDDAAGDFVLNFGDDSGSDPAADPLGDAAETSAEPEAETGSTVEQTDESSDSVQLDLTDGTDGYFGTLDAETEAVSLSFSPSEDGPVDVVVASSFGDADTELAIHDSEGNLITASTTEGLEGFQTVSFAGKADQVYELTISSEPGVSGNFQVTVGADAATEAEPDSETDSATDGLAETTTDPSSEETDETSEVEIDIDNGDVETENSEESIDVINEGSTPDAGEEESHHEESHDDGIPQDGIPEADTELDEEIAADEVDEFDDAIVETDLVSDDSSESDLPTDVVDEPTAEPADESTDDLVSVDAGETSDDSSHDVEVITEIIDSVVDTIVVGLEELGHDVGDLEVNLTPIETIVDEVANDSDVVPADETEETNEIDETVELVTDETEQPTETDVTDAVPETEVADADSDEISSGEVPTETEEADQAGETVATTDADQPLDAEHEENCIEESGLEFVDGVIETSGELAAGESTEAVQIVSDTDGEIVASLDIDSENHASDAQVTITDGDTVIASGTTNDLVGLRFDAFAGTEYQVAISSVNDGALSYSLVLNQVSADSVVSDGTDDEQLADDIVEEVVSVDEGTELASESVTDLVVAADDNTDLDSEQEFVDDFFTQNDFEWAFSFDGDRFYSRVSQG